MQIEISLEEKTGGHVFAAEFGWAVWHASVKSNMNMVCASRSGKCKIIRSWNENDRVRDRRVKVLVISYAGDRASDAGAWRMRRTGAQTPRRPRRPGRVRHEARRKFHAMECGVEGARPLGVHREGA
jgi:hypothetical protein